MAQNLFDRGADALVIFSRLWGRQTWFIFLILFGLYLTLIPFTWPNIAQARNQPTEIRGVWLTNIDSDVLFDKNSLTEGINTLSQLNFNTLYPTVWNWGYTLYPSTVAESVIGQKLDPTEGLQGRDILQETIEQGHKKGMAVIPWFEFGFMAPADSELAKRHDQWLTNRQDGSKIWLEGNVHQRVWLNPFHPEVQGFITQLITELVTNYDIDGIQVDDHFGIPFDFGYDDFTVKLYQQEHNGQLPPKPPANLKMGSNNCMVNDAAWTEWTQWRANKITDYMGELFTAIKAANPKVIVSVSPNPQTFSANCFLLDWQTWQQKGLIEELVLQVYRENLRDFQREINSPEVQQAKANIPFGVGVLSGLKGRPVSMNKISEQVAASRKQKLAGVSFFFYESLWNFGPKSPKERQFMFKQIFPTLVSRPSINP
ncbi:glycoside hydrolase family 10 protein [Crocosphaera sp. UHCC 0190]|uniref:glycoside hydrolase family 10 protein n=1 Tax=Crocosphaera sp. UHCC 0190 TaxID=3110246 RepID=UPI002B1EA7C8|nr:glycoside hydrolase family 10 protein [Crocosphaera sp. UHCC 0190]MEA5511440.1 glycoside hydrolase family 10 protein [Crocosphaera sp. UHCC 0190]